MKLLGIRFCHVADQSAEVITFLSKLGLGQKDCGAEEMGGGVFPVDGSWVEIWPASEAMPAGTMLQLVVDDARAFAEHAKSNGHDLGEGMEAHGELIYFSMAGGLPISIQSALL